MLFERPFLAAGVNKRKSGFFPALYSAAEYFDVAKPLFHIFCRPTGSTRLQGSASVEDDLLVSGQGSGPLLELGIRRAAF